MALNGNNIIITMGGTAIAGCKSHKIQTGADTIEIASATSGKWREFIAGRQDWSIAVNYLVLAASGVKDILKVGTTVQLVIRDREGTNTVTGSAIIVDAEQTYTRGNLVQGSYKFKGSGALT